MVEEKIVERENRGSWLVPAIVVLGIIGVVALGFGWNASSKLDTTQKAVTAQVQTMRQAVDQDLAGFKDRLVQSEKTNSELQGDLNVVTKKLRITQGQLKTAREESTKAQEQASEKITALDTSVHTELATKAAVDDVKNVDTKVVGVRTDLDATREEVKMARSEMGTLIARNHDEIEQLRRLGEREYTEFTIAGKNRPQKVGNVTVELRAVNVKKNQFTLNLTAEDKQIEKKNRSLNEPIFFYMSATRLPQELVINKVGKDTISGYVSIPKANSQQTQSSSSSSGR
jgi:chromosome segregation ATPase